MSEINWGRYAKEYDYMCKYTPMYQELMLNTKKHLCDLNIEPKNICEFGSGTGNFTIDVLNSSFPESNILSIEYVPEFLDRQNKKIINLGLENKIQLIKSDIRTASIKNSSMDLILMNHVLNFFNLNERDDIVQNAFDSLNKDGYFVISDIGRNINVFKLGVEIYLHAFKKYGLKKTIELYNNTCEVRKQNVQANKRQRKNISFMHNLDEFKNYIKDFGFEIIFSTNKYFGGIDDFLIAKKL